MIYFKCCFCDNSYPFPTHFCHFIHCSHHTNAPFSLLFLFKIHPSGYLLDNPLTSPWLFAEIPSSCVTGSSCQSGFLPIPRPQPPCLLHLDVVSHLNEQLDSFIPYKCWIRLIALIPLGVANWFYPRMYHFSCFLFFSCKEKEPCRQQASPEWKIKNLDITYLAALLPIGLCKTQLNVSPLNTALQYITQKILQA